jgi:serine protease
MGQTKGRHQVRSRTNVSLPLSPGRRFHVRRIAPLVVALLALGIMPAGAQAAPPNDAHWRFQWGPRQVKAPEAWRTSTGVGQTVAIVDSGVDLRHPDLGAKIAGGATFVGCPRRRNGCGNGDWRSGVPANGEGDPHGTHVAGIAAAVTNNRRGIAGTAPAARILAVKVLDSEGGTFEEIAAGIRWSVDHGADVVNLSLGALPGVQALVITGLITDVQDAIAYADRKGVAVVAAAGNEFASICGTPASDTGALCVTATDRREQRAAYSNFAVKENLDVVAAPGGAAFLSCEEDVISTVPIVPVMDRGFCEKQERTPGYDFFAGTSMATPHVAGVAALLAAQGRSDEGIMRILERTARTPMTGARGSYTPVWGYGIVDAAAAVAAP